MEISHQQILLYPLQSPPPSQVRIQTHCHVRTHRHCHRTHLFTQLDYPNNPYLLTEEIYNRRGKKSRFTEVELWFLLWGLAKARIQAQSAG